MQEVKPTDPPAIEAFKFGSGCRWTSQKIGLLGVNLRHMNNWKGDKVLNRAGEYDFKQKQRLTFQYINLTAFRN